MAIRKMTKGKVLVTGASGFLGRRSVEILSERGFSVRALVRRTSKIGSLKRTGVEIYVGDVSDISTLKPAFEGIDFVVHTAADNSGTKEGAQRVTIGGTRNILDLCSKFPVEKLIYISSCSVYGVADCRDGQIINENGPLEKYPERRGVYSWAKIEAEKLVRDCMEKGTVPVACLRPGTIYGPGGKYFTPMMGFSFRDRLFVIIGNENLVLPLIYIDNLIDVIIRAIKLYTSIDKIYNAMDASSLTKKSYVDFLLRKLYPRSLFIYIPYTIALWTVSFQELLTNLLGCRAFLTTYRLISSQKNVRYSANRLLKDLMWVQRLPTRNAITRILDYERLRLAAGKTFDDNH
jgi:2-alkyl-3-oxoalkanoate reductase